MTVKFGAMKGAICIFSLALLVSCGGGSSTTGNTGTNNGTTDTPLVSEGTTSTPVRLTVDTARTGAVGGLLSGFTSYYYFHTNTAGGYQISVTNVSSNDFGFVLYSDHFTTSLGQCDDTYKLDEKCVYSLAANTDYYVSVTNWSFAAASFSIIVRDLKSQGTASSPVSLASAVTATYTGSVEASSASYYLFTPGSDGAYTFAFTDADYYGRFDTTNTPLQIDIYSSSDFSSGLLQSCVPSYYNTYCTANNLTAGAPCYIKVTEAYSAQHVDVVYSIRITGGSGEGTPANPVVLTVGSPHAGTIEAGSNPTYQGCYNPSYNYYTFTTSGAGGYTVTMDNIDSLSVKLYSSLSSTIAINSCDPPSALSPCEFSNLNSSTSYYLRVGNCNSGDVSYNMNIVKEGSEGSISNPVPLTLDAAHSGSIGFYETSYFTFTTDKSGTYYIVLDQNLNYAYYSNPDFMSGTGDSGSGTTITKNHANLDANKTYYLRVYAYGVTGIMQYNVSVIHGASEGSTANPAALTVGTTYSGKVESGGRSYYKFTTGSAADYYVKFDNPTDLWVFAYSNADFTNGSFTASCTPGPGTYVTCTLQNLSASTPYYIEADERTYTSDATYGINMYLLDYLAGCNAGSECYNFEGGLTTPFTLTSTVTSGNKNASYWLIDNAADAATGGTKSLKSGVIPYDATTPQSTCIEYAKSTDTSEVLFSFKTDTDYFNQLKFYIDGTAASGGTLYNTASWRRVIFFPTAGAHTYKWCFEKGTSYITGSDAVWVDDIEFR